MRKSFLLILVASALLLSAASYEPIKPSPESTSTPESERSQIAQQPNAGQTVQNGSRPSITPLNQTKTPDVSDGQNSPDASAQKEATYTGLLVIVGLLAVILNYCTTKSAAGAAKQSARAAELGLKANRPYLLVVVGKMRGFDIIKSLGFAPLPESKFTLRNFGKGAALIDKILIKLRTVDDFPAVGDFSECEEHKLTVEAVGAGGLLRFNSNPMDGAMSVPQAKAIIDGRKKLIAYGCVYYFDVFGNPYETAFCWCYKPFAPEMIKLMELAPVILKKGPPHEDVPKGIFTPEPKSNNYHR